MDMQFIFEGDHCSESYDIIRQNFITIRESFTKNLQQAESYFSTDLKNCVSDENKLSTVKKFFEWKNFEPKTLPEFEKSASISGRFRENGNMNYKCRNHSAALRSYNLAIIFAPNKSTEIVLAYSNLSALFLEMKDYVEASKAVEIGLQQLENTRLNLPELSNKLKQRRTKCQNRLSTSRQNNNTSSYITLHEKLKSPSPKLNATEDFVELQHDQQSGRKLIVTREISTGTTLLVEKPFSVTLDQELSWDTTHCHNCYNKIKTGIPCEECVFVLYCSLDCLNESHNSSHKYECKCLPYFFINSNNGPPFISERLLLALRIICKVGPDNIVRQSKEVDTDYYKICGLIKHESQLEVYLTKAFESLLLVEVLDSCTGFFKNDPSIKHYVAYLVVQHLESIPFNAISFSELDKKNYNLISTPFATGIFPTISLINHSCVPNALHIKNSKYLTSSVIAIRKLKEGEEILISYGPMYTRKSRQERRSELFRKYKFNCQCKACSENWTESLNFRYLTKKPDQYSKVKEIENELHIIFDGLNGQSLTELNQSRKILETHLDYLASFYDDNFNLIQVCQELFKKCLIHLINSENQSK